MASKTANGDKDPPSTLALFSTILQKAENDFLQSQSTTNNATQQQQQQQQATARAKLFHITTQLAKLNLQDDLLVSSSSSSKASIENGSRLWELILDFMNRYPDYALYKSIIQEPPTVTAARHDHVEEEETTTEEMSIWLLPRLLRCMILLNTTTVHATSHGNRALETTTPNERVVEQDMLLHKGEAWVKQVISDQLRLFYHREEGGLKKRREWVTVLIKLAQDATSLAIPGSDTIFPSKLYIFQDKHNIATRPTVKTGGADVFFAQDGQNSSSKNDRRPLYITIDDKFQADILRLSIIRILISTIAISEQWIYDFVPEVLELIIGQEEDWTLPHLTPSSLHSANRVKTKEAFRGRMEGIRQRVGCTKDVYKLCEKVPLPQASLRAILLRVIHLFLSPQLPQYRQEELANMQDGEGESSSSIARLEEALTQIVLSLYGACKRGNRRGYFEMADIARRYRRSFIDILRSEQEILEQKKSNSIAVERDGQDNRDVNIIQPGMTIENITDRQCFCLIMLSIAEDAPASTFTMTSTSSISNTVLRDITNIQREQETERMRHTNQKSVYSFDASDASDILEVLWSYKTGPASRHNASEGDVHSILPVIIEKLIPRCEGDIAYRVDEIVPSDRNGSKRKTAPDDENHQENENSVRRKSDIAKMQVAILKEAFSFQSTSAVHASEPLQWKEVVADFLSKQDLALQENHFQAIEALACSANMDILDENAHGRTTCSLCQRQFTMGDLPSRNSEDLDTSSSNLLSSMKNSFSKMDTISSTTRTSFWRAFSAVLIHSGEQPHSLYAWLDLVSQDLKHQNRLVRLSAGYAGNMIITELFRHDHALNSNGQLSNYFNMLENGLKYSKPPVKLTTTTVISDMIRIGSGAILGKVLSLGVIALAAQGQLRAIFTAQLDNVFKSREVSPYKFFSPYLHQLCPIIARHLDSSFALLYTLTDLLRTTVQSFLQTPDIARIFLSEAILSKREDVIQILAESMEISTAELLVLNADICFAPLYFLSSSKFEECRSFYMGILQSQSFKTTFQQLLEGDLPAVLLEVLIRADPENARQLDSIIQRIFKDLNGGHYLSLKDATALLGRSGTILAVFGRAGDSLRGMYGKKNSEERALLLQGMEILVSRVGQLVSGAAPQIMTILQTSFKDREIRLPALRLWKRFLETLRIEEVKPLIAQTTAVFIQAWPDLSLSEKALVKSILQYFLVDQYKNLEDALTGIADMSSIPELDSYQKRLLTRRQGQSAEERIKAYLTRLDTVNEATLVQTLRELLQHLKCESANIQKLAAGSSFSPLLGETIHTLLSTAIRSSEAKSPARALALQCLGVLGALDPDRMTFPPEESAFVIEHDLRNPDECMRFAIYTVDKVLLRVLRTTNDPQQQTALYLAIQGLAAVCGFNESLRSGNTFKQGIDAGIRMRWNALPRHVQDVVEPLISASIKVESSVKAEKPEYPLYSNRTSYREWLQTWTSDLIDHLVQGNSSVTLPHSPAKLFGPLRAAVRRGHDLTVPHYILPFLVFFTITSGNTTQTANISQEIQTVLQDQISPSKELPMPPDSRSLCAQAVFELMDRLNTWRRARLVLVSKRFRRRESDNEIQGHLFYTKKIDSLFQSLPQNMVADAAFNAKSHARALLNYERILYGFGSKQPSSQLQNYYERLHNIYAELNEPDGMEGVSVSIISPSLEHQIREHEMTGRWTSAQSCWEVQLQLQPDNPASHLGLLRCLRNLGHYDSLKTHIAGLQVKHANWQNELSPYELESALISGDIAAISSALEQANPACPEAAFARVVLASKESPGSSHATAFLEAAESLGSTITTASKDSYHRFYDTVVKLHMLHEIETLFTQSTVGGAAHRRQSKADQADFAARLELTSPAFNTREAILNMRRNTYRLCGAEEHTNDIGPLWLVTSKIAIKAQHLQTAYSAILQANQLKADFAFMQSAKLYHANNQLHRALQEIEQGLKLLGALDASSSNKLNYDPSMLKKLAKATLRSARWMQETGRFEHAEIMARYSRAIKLSPEWEAAYYRMGQYADDMVQASPPFEKKPAADGRAAKTNEILLSCMEICVHFFSRALRFGAKYIYQALPRMVTIWLDMGAWPDIAVLPIEAIVPGTAGAAANNPKMRKIEQLKQNQLPAIKSAVSMFEKIYGHIRRSLDKLPPYMWLSVLPQLVSRVNHESTAVYAQLVYLIERVIQHYPQQAIWTMLGVLYSVNNARRDRCTQILKRAQASPASAANQALTATVRTLQELVRCFLEMAAMKVEGSGTLSMAQTFPALKAMVPCDIIIPLQNAMTITLPTDEKVFAHKPFPSDLVTFQGFKDEVDIMSSVAKPRKIVIIGSDGRSYRFLCKPLDDLRKDNRFNECTALIGKLLMKDPEARKRGLGIRGYAVIPLSEQCGLIEWVPDTQGIRHLFISCYEPRGISVWNDHLKKVYETLKTAQKNDLAKCGKAFTEEILPTVPPIFHEWFMSNFPEPTAWFKARTNYGRTAAVMSMVGFVLGLGDRHGENILIDSTNGDVVHVDFNCLFGMGQVHFDIAEKVPFRLTQNVIDGFGITGVEGVFRRCCEITLRILRENRNSLISVLESFVHDPLLDLQLTRGGKVERKNIGAARNETKEQKARREEEQRKSEARNALAIISNKLKGTQSTTFPQENNASADNVVSVEMTVETLFKEATDPKNLGGMYCGWASWL